MSGVRVVISEVDYLAAPVVRCVRCRRDVARLQDPVCGTCRGCVIEDLLGREKLVLAMVRDVRGVRFRGLHKIGLGGVALDLKRKGLIDWQGHQVITEVWP